MLQVMLPDVIGQVHLVYPDRPKMSPDEFLEFCQANPDVSFELTGDGEIVIRPPVTTEASSRNLEVLRVLANWAAENGG